MDNLPFIKNLDGVQQTLAKYFEITVADFVARGGVIDIELPPNAEIIAGAMTVTDQSDQQTTDTLAFGDSASAARYLAATSIKTATGTRTPLVPTGYITTPETNKLRITRVTAGTAATKGKVRIWFQYVHMGQADFTQG